MKRGVPGEIIGIWVVSDFAETATPTTQQPADTCSMARCEPAVADRRLFSDYTQTIFSDYMYISTGW